MSVGASSSRQREQVSGMIILLVVLLGAATLRMLTGRVPQEDGSIGLVFALPIGEITSIRFTATLAAALVGGCLGLSGLAFQVLLRNPLASPFVLGVSSGAGLGIMLGQWMASVGGALGVMGAVLLGGHGAIGAGLGAIVALLIVQFLGRRLGGFDPVSLVLAGIIVSATFAAAIMLLQHLVPHGLRDDFGELDDGENPVVTAQRNSRGFLSDHGRVLRAWRLAGSGPGCVVPW